MQLFKLEINWHVYSNHMSKSFIESVNIDVCIHGSAIRRLSFLMSF